MVGMAVAQPMKFGPFDSVHWLGRDAVVVRATAEIGRVGDPRVCRQHRYTILGNQRRACDGVKTEHANPTWLRYQILSRTGQDRATFQPVCGNMRESEITTRLASHRTTRDI